MLLTQTFKGSSQIRDVLVLENLNFVPDLWGKYEDYLLEVAGKKDRGAFEQRKENGAL